MTAAFTPKTRSLIHLRDGWCVGCGTSASLTIQHRKSRGMGSTKDQDVRSASNGILLCGSGTTGCHGWAERHPVDAAFLGWRVSQHDSPRDVPCWRGTSQVDGNWYLLDDDGDVTQAPDNALAALAALHASELVRRAS